MALATTANIAATITERMEMQKSLGMMAAEVGARYLADFAFQKDELESGRKLFQERSLSNYIWRLDNTYFIASSGQIEQDVCSVANAKQWPAGLAEQVKGFARVESIVDNEMIVKFCSDTSSACSMHIIATFRDQTGNQHIKVFYVENGFTLAPTVERVILEDKEPIFVKKKSGFRFGPLDFRSSKMVCGGYKRTQRVETHVTPQTFKGGDAEKMHTYVKFKMCQAVCRMYREALNGSTAEAQSMLTWGE